MDSFFAVIASASLVFSWVTGHKLAAVDIEALSRDACTERAEYQAIAIQNATTLATASIAPFGRIEAGWKIYAPQIAQTIGTPCAPDSKGFAATLANWQAQHRITPTGAVNLPTLVAMKSSWQQACPFVTEFASGACPTAALESALAEIAPREGWSGKISKLDPRALQALRVMTAAARAADPRLARDRQMFTIVSAYRSPAYDAARCAKEKNCNGTVRASCSAHRTGKAIDIYIGALPGHSPVGADDANRLFQTQGPAYRWLVKNAARFGFVNYVFEPWHWEWVGNSAPQTEMVAASEEERSLPRPRVRTASMTGTKPLADLSARLRLLFGSN